MEKHFKHYNLEINKEISEKFNIYAAELIEWNKKFNLTSHNELDKIAVWHFIDCCLVYNLLNLKNERIIDMGSGAGFPGMVFAILNPDLNILLVDSVLKKVTFLEHIKNILNIKNVEIKHLHLTQKNNLNEKFDCVISRAFMKPNELLTFSKNYINKNGKLIMLLTENQKNEFNIDTGILLKYLFEGQYRYVLKLEG